MNSGMRMLSSRPCTNSARQTRDRSARRLGRALDGPDDDRAGAKEKRAADAGARELDAGAHRQPPGARAFCSS
jgi:hypothetical protein